MDDIHTIARDLMEQYFMNEERRAKAAAAKMEKWIADNPDGTIKFRVPGEFRVTLDG